MNQTVSLQTSEREAPRFNRRFELGLARWITYLTAIAMIAGLCMAQSILIPQAIRAHGEVSNVEAFVMSSSEDTRSADRKLQMISLHQSVRNSSLALAAVSIVLILPLSWAVVLAKRRQLLRSWMAIAICFVLFLVTSFVFSPV